MKNFILATATLFVGANLFGQTVPKGISYQAVAINTESQSVAGVNPENAYWSNKDIQVRFTIYDQYPGGTAQMVENHQTKTDKFGVFNLVIGQGQNISGDLFDVEWEKGQAHLQVEIDFQNDGDFTLIGIEKFWSVPYSIESKSKMVNQLDSLLSLLQNQLDMVKKDLDIYKSKPESGWIADSTSTNTNKLVQIENEGLVNLRLRGKGFTDLAIEAQDAGDADLWLSNLDANVTWRLHNDQSENNIFALRPWTKYPSGSILVPFNPLQIETDGSVSIGADKGDKPWNDSLIQIEKGQLNVFSNSGSMVNVVTSGNKDAGIQLSELQGSRGARIIVDGDNTNNLIFQVTDDGPAPKNFVDVMHMPFFPGSKVGNVGIGESDPAYKLDIKGPYSTSQSSALLRLTRGGINELKFIMSGSSTTMQATNKRLSVGTSDQQVLSLYTNGETRMVMDGTGNTGFGTTAPKRTLHVNRYMRLEPTSFAPNNPAMGDIYFNKSTRKLMVYDGTNWRACF